jgi:hypothetical protein
MVTFKYQDVKPIRPYLCQAWMVKLPDGTKIISLWSEDCSIEHIHHHVKIHFPEFVMQRMDVGQFHVVDYKGTDMSYSGDGRGINQDWEVVIS